jgi:hypothetical protein
MSKAEVQAAFAKAHKRSVKIGDTLRIWMGDERDMKKISTDIAKEIRAALKRGETVVENGVSQWITEQEIITPGQSGSMAYTWSKCGNKIKVGQWLVVKQADGAVQQTFLCHVWKKL